MDSYFRSVICILAIVQTSMLQSVTRFSLPPSGFGRGLSRWWLEFLYGLPTLSDCARECYYVRVCASFQFDKAKKWCILNTTNSTNPYATTWYTGSQFIFSNKMDWPQAIAGSCANEPCSLKEKCVPSRIPSCVIYCGSLPGQTGAFNYAGCSTAGCRLKMECYPGFASPEPNPKATCQTNGTWTFNFQCIRHCGTPPSVSNAIVGPGLEYQDANRTYTCQEPYVATSSSTTISCQANSNWTTPQFECTV